jgi:pyruvate,water dikinase
MSMSICVDLAAVRAAGSDPPSTRAAIGGKARSLLRLAGAGLRVPPAFAITDALFRRLRAGGPPLPGALRGAGDLGALDRARDQLLAAPWPADFLAELAHHLDRLAPGEGDARFSIRSSFAREDDGRGLAAGVYESVVGVARAGVPDAVRRVLASALSAGAFAYAHNGGSGGGADEARAEPSAAVLVHRYLGGRASGTAAFDPDSGQPPVVEVTAGALGDAQRADAERALRLLARRHGPVEVEWVDDGDHGGELTFLQLRPYRAPPPPRVWAPAAMLGEGDWRWDVAHNPLPLSPAQAGLVALVDARCRIGIRQRVAGGYLFCAPDDAPAGPATEVIDPASTTAALAALSAELEARLDALGERPPLEEVLALFVATYGRLYGGIQPAARAATRALESFLSARLDGDLAGLPRLYAAVPSIASERRQRAEELARAGSQAARATALAAYLARFGDESPIWDVAVPTYREDPGRLRARFTSDPDAPVTSSSASRDPERAREDRGAAVHRAPEPDRQAAAREIAERLPAPARGLFASLLAAARQARAVGEDDDWVYARAQAAVRAALRREGERLVALGRLVEPADVFWLPLDQVRSLARGEGPPAAALAERVAAARAAHQQALQDPPVLTELAGAARAFGRSSRVIRGQRASSGRVIGPAFVYRQPGMARGPTSASIVVAASLLPTELPLLPAAGLVVESGGLLGHVAAQARERGLPALVAAHGASTSITDGELLLLDADAGHVVRLG